MFFLIMLALVVAGLFFYAFISDKGAHTKRASKLEGTTKPSANVPMRDAPPFGYNYLVHERS